MRPWILAVALALGAAPPAIAYSGTELHQDCSDAANNPYCLGYVRGILNGYLVGKFLSGLDCDVCPPENHNMGQALDIVIKRLREDPEHRAGAAGAIAYAALESAWMRGCEVGETKPARGGLRTLGL